MEQQHYQKQQQQQQRQPHAVIFDQNGGSYETGGFYQSNFSPPQTNNRNIGCNSNNSNFQQSFHQHSWFSAFGSGGFEGEAPLFEELGINFGHIRSKTTTVLNPFRSVSTNIMDDTDLIGPLLFCLLFGATLLLTGKVQFGYIYGLAMLGWMSIWAILNLMSQAGIDIYRTASVLGYCLLPMVLLSSISVLLRLRGLLGYGLGVASILWCTYSSSTIFVTVLGMKDQRFL